MAQFSRPNATTTIGSWTANGGPSTLHECIDETSPSDSDYIEGGSGSSENRIEIDDTITDPAMGTGHIMRVRWQGFGSGGPERVSMDLYEGTTLRATAFDSYAPGRSFVTETYTLSEAEADAITDYTDLNVRWTVDAAGGGEGIQVSFFEFEVPDVVVGYNQLHFRVRDDDSKALTANAAEDWADALDTNVTIDWGKNFRVRFEVEQTGTGSSKQFKLQFNKNSTSWEDFGLLGAVLTKEISMAYSVQYADGDATTDLLSGSAETFSAGEAKEALSATTSAITLTAQHTEYEFCMIMENFHGSPIGQNANSDTFELRLVESDGTPFTGTYVNPTITLNAVDNYIGIIATETPNAAGPFMDGNGNMYYMGEIEDADGPTIQMVKSTDEGKTWALADAAGNPTQEDLEAAGMVQVDDVLHILHHRGGGQDIFYYTFHTSDNATTPDTWVIDELVAITTDTGQSCDLAVRSDGDIWAFWRDTVSGNQRIKYARRNGTWGTVNDVDGTASTDFEAVSVVMGESNKVHIFYTDTTNSDIFHRSLDESETLSPRQAVTTTADLTFDQPHVPPVYWDDAGVEKIMFGWIETGGRIYTTIISDDGTPSAGVEASENTVANDTRGSDQPTADLSMWGKKVQFLYARASDQDLYYDTNDNGGGWGTNTEEVDGKQFDFIRGQVLTLANNAIVLAYIFEDGSNNGDAGYSWYGSKLLQAGTEQPIGQFARRMRVNRNVNLRR